ncbi:60S ribosomal protein L28 [Lemmus lemmus]
MQIWSAQNSYFSYKNHYQQECMATLSIIRHIIQKKKYRWYLRMAAIGRASAILQRQKPVVVKRKWAYLTKSS